MSRSATVSTSKNPPQLPSKSAWARGPPQQNSAITTPSRSQSPAPPTPVSTTTTTSFHATHSRRSSALGQGVSIKDGVSIPRNAVKQGSAVTFGSIDDASAPISSSPASAPAVKPAEGVKSFGSVAVQNGVSDATKSVVANRPPPLSSTPSLPSSQTTAVPASTPSPVPKFDRKSIAKLFQGPSTQSVQTPPSEAASPASRSASLPSQPGQGQPYPPTFASGALRQGQNGNPSAPPRSPVYTRPMSNGQNGGVGVSGRPQAGSGGPSAGPTPAALPSPRLTPHPPPGPSSGLPPPPTMWPGYYYHPSFVSGVPPDQLYPPPQWPGHFMPPQHQPPPPHHPPGPGPSSAGLPMSPRNPPLPLQQVPGTPTQSHAIPPILHPPHPPAPHPPAPHPPPSVTSPPPTPSAANRSTSLSANAGPFVPGKKISIKNPSSGQEVNLDTLKRMPPPTVPVVPPSPAPAKKDIKRPPIRIESQEQKEKRLAEERAKGSEGEEKNKPTEVAVKVAEDAARRQIEEQERRQAEERKAKEEAHRAEKERKEAEERAAREEKERKEAEDRAAREEEERKEAEERAAREAREAEERREPEEKAERERVEQERLRKLQEEEARAKEEAERQRKAEEEALRAAEAARPLVDATSDAKPDSPPEEGEIEDEVSQPAAAIEEPAPTSTSAPAPLPAHIPAELPSKPLDKESLRIDTSLPSPDHSRKRPGPLNLQTTINSNIAPSLPSALATARHIEDINRITYPEGIKSPKVELNVNTQKGKFRYDRDFLLQFMNICKEKPDNLPPLDVIGLEPSDTSHTMSRGGSGRSRTSNSMSMPGNTRSASIGLGFLPGSMGKSAGSGFQMGQFSTSASKMSSEERFHAASSGRSASVSGGPLIGRPPAMVRTISQGGTGSRDRTRSKRGANDSNRASVVVNTGPTIVPVPNMGPPMELIVPLEVSVNRWVASSSRRSGSGLDSELPEVVERKVKALLNKLAMERFDSISDQIIAWANKSEKEKDGRTLIQVIKLVFEKATDEATFSEMYARLCRKMMEQISPKVQDDGIKNTEGKPFAGGQLFRKYLLNRCQEDFERGWVAKETTAAAAATKANEDRAGSNEKAKGGEESELYSEEYYAAAKAKRRGLGLIRFIGELFKLQMLTERIMHECIKKLLGNVENPEEEEIESLCKLLTTVGSLLDTPKARAHLDVYFSRMRELTKNKNVNARMVFMLQDVIELRERKWIPRNAVAAPTTIAQVHENAAKEKAAQEKDSLLRQNASMSRGGSRRGGNRDAAEAPHPDGWSVAGPGPPRVQPKAGDLSNFGKINKATPMTFGPGSVFAGKKGDLKNRDSPMSRTASSSNMFSMLQSSDVVVEPPTSKSSRPPSRKSSVDFGSSGASEPAPQRRKLQLLPRTKPVGEESKVSTPAVSEAGSDDEAAGEASIPVPMAMSEAEAVAKIGEDVKEFFSVRLLDEAESYFSSLPTEHRCRLVDTLVMKSIEMKEPDVKLVSDLFVRVREKDLCSLAVFEEGFNTLAELLDDLAVDIPKAWPYFIILLKGSGLEQDEERRARIGEKTMNADKLNRLL
ncbi:hypothetical protein B0F90DRAFT_1627403 [Multifurca ochricompacta]|uniref:MI domain-containing protein n=1 Tax=Multifurca ochricompacta TaxID=376703 RepID=A0AAD4M5X5_9AGAM|nr:hypothetical protein B0F90DRAFT_1627403 [Multifurca ochricompacta]